jgi:hypothetical protein
MRSGSQARGVLGGDLRSAREARERNEAEATERALSLARAALDEATIERLRADGATLRDAEIAAVAFAVDGGGKGGS